MAANKPFKHQALNLDRTQIRLFRLLPADRSGNLAGTIAIYDFEHCPEYRAVSYTWGLPYPTREISLEGQSFTVRENLWQFLDAARDYVKDWLWVDQVCIDQSTVDERNHQVSLVAKIYAKAFEVLIWLGTEAHGSGKAMEAINSGVDSIHQYESEVQSLFRRPYWDRLWILQEVLMGQNILVLCGNQSFTWKRLEALFVPQGIEDRLWTYPVHIYKVALSLIEEKASFKGANRRLSYMLESFAGLQCEDTRDKVYGLLSLVRISGVIPVDYSKTSADVFFNAIQRIVRDESFMEINSHFNVGQHLRDRMVLVNISDTEIFDFINKELPEKRDQTALWLAATNGHEGKVKLLLDQSADVEAADEYGRTPLYQASNNGHVDVVRLLLDRGADVEVADSNGWKLLYRASYNGHIDVVRLLLEKGADVVVASHGRTPLLSASTSGHVEIVKLLLEKGADVTVASQEGWTPLHSASGRGHIEIGKLLLATEKVDADSKNKWGRTPLSYAAAHGHETVVKLLIEKGAEFNTWAREVQSMLQAAASKGNHSLLQLLIGKAKNVDI
jgi:ankyrin repeat protein